MQIADSSRLRYQFVTAEDADFLWQVDQDEAVMRYINGGTKTSRADIEGVFLPRLQAYANQPLGWGLWKVSLLETPHTALGWVLVRPMGFFTDQADPDNLELGWRFKQPFWGKGFATEAATALRDALRDTGVSQFSAIALPDNHASIAIMKKLGMAYSHTMHYQDEVFNEQVVVYSHTC